MTIPTIKDVAVIQAQLSLLDPAPYALAFTKPRSANWPLVQDVCRKFGTLTEHDGITFSQFGTDIPALKGLENVLSMISGWNSAILFVDGEREETYRMTQWLQCFLRSFYATSPEAYCLKTTFTHLSFVQQTEQYLSPCRLLSLANITENHPASLVDQVQSLAIDNGCFRCPNFNAENFRVYA